MLASRHTLLTLARHPRAVHGQRRLLAAPASSSDLFKTTIAAAPKVAPAETPASGLPQRASAKHSKIKTSILKLKEVCRQVRGMDVEQAIRQLEVNPRKVAMEVRKCITMARNNAVQLGLPKEGLVVSGYVIGRATPMKRLDIKAKGRFGIIQRVKTNLEVFVAPLHALPGRKSEWRRQKAQIKQRYTQWKQTAEPAAAKAATAEE